MTYRDQRDALHARNEALEREVASLRAALDASPPTPPRRSAGAALAAVGIIAALAVFAGTAVLLVRLPAPAPPPRPVASVLREPAVPPYRPSPTPPPPTAGFTPPSPLAELASARSGTMESIARVYSAVVTRASPGAPVPANTACTVRLRRAANVCFVDARCGDWSPYPHGAVTVCSIDDQGLPHGGIHMGPSTGQPTAVQMDGTRFELSDERPGNTFLLTLRLGDATAEPVAAGASGFSGR